MAANSRPQQQSHVGEPPPPEPVDLAWPSAAAEPVLVDCDRCSVRGAGCPDCVVTFLLGGPPDDVQLDADERRALDVLASAGLVPPLRMVEAVDSRSYDHGP